LEADVDLVRDIEDKLVLDRDGREIGRVDRVLLELRTDGPHVVALEIGPAVLATRLSARLGRWIAALEYALGYDGGRPFEVPVDAIIAVQPHIRIDRAFSDTPAATIEAALRSWLPRLPGAR
jgi:sporulation protein YlmC with PRC-barrel domain